MTVFGGKLGKNAPNMAFFGALRANRGTFLLIYSKSAENKMSFEIHVTTIATGSLSFGLKNPRGFCPIKFFSKMLKNLKILEDCLPKLGEKSLFERMWEINE